MLVTDDVGISVLPARKYASDESIRSLRVIHRDMPATVAVKAKNEMTAVISLHDSDVSGDILRKEIYRRQHHRKCSGRFPGHDRDRVIEGIAIQANQVFGRKIGQHQRPGDDPCRQASSCEEVRFR